MVSKTSAWQVHIPSPQETNYSHHDVQKPNEQHQFDLLYVPHKVFEGNTYKYILTDVDVTSRYKVARALRSKKTNEVLFLLKAIYKKGDFLKYPKAFQFGN